MKKQIITLLLLISIQWLLFGQTDSTWNVVVLKQNSKLEIKDDMTKLNNTGFYLYRNCFYDLQLKDKSIHTLRLVDITKDTLVFIGISKKTDVDFSVTSMDTTRLHSSSIQKLLMLRSGSGSSYAKINCKDYHFVFYKDVEPNVLESKYAKAFASEEQTELVPRFIKSGTSYYFEYAEKLRFYPRMEIVKPKYTNEQKEKTLNIMLKALDLIVNRRVTFTVEP